MWLAVFAVTTSEAFTRRTNVISRLRIYGVFLALLLPFNAHGQSDTGASNDDPLDFVFWSENYVEAAADRLEKSLGDKDLVWETVGRHLVVGLEIGLHTPGAFQRGPVGCRCCAAGAQQQTDTDD